MKRLPTRGILATALFTVLLVGIAFSQKNNSPETMLRAAMDKETVDGDLKAAIEQYKKVIAQKGASKDVVAKALVRLGGAYEKQGSAEARPAYERVLREYADQTDAVQQASARLAAIPSKTAGISLRQVCAGPDCDGEISPDGRYLVFSPDENIFVHDLMTGHVRQLTHVPVGTHTTSGYAWAPVSQRVAYVDEEISVSPRSVGNMQAVIVNLDGSASRIVYRGRGESEVLGWSGDEKKLLILIRGDRALSREPRLMWIGVADSIVQSIPLPSTGFNLQAATVSPDGQYIAFNGFDGSSANVNVHVMASDGSGNTIVAPNKSAQIPVGWTPDGKQLLFVEKDLSTDKTFLSFVPIEGGKPGVPMRVSHDLGGDLEDCIGITHSGAVYCRIRTSTNDIFTASLDPETGKITSPVQLPLSRSGHNDQPHWSPDGRRILHGWGQPVGTVNIDIREVWIYSMDSGRDQQVASNVVALRRGMCWGADGASILFNTLRPLATNTNQFSEPIRFSLTTGEVTTLFPGAASYVMDSCSEGLVANWDPQGLAIKVRSLKTGIETEVHKFSQRQTTRFSPYLSHDGRLVAFREVLADGSAGLYVVSTDGGPAKELVEIKAPVEFNSPIGLAWSPDDRFVYFGTRPDSKTPYEMFRVSVSGGAAMSTEVKNFGNMEIAPDGKRIAFNRGGQQSEIWSMENFLPSGK